MDFGRENAHCLVHMNLLVSKITCWIAAKINFLIASFMLYATMLHFHAMVQSSTRTNYDKYLRKSIIAVLIPKLSVLRIFMH